MLAYYDGQVGYGATLQTALQKVFGTAPAQASTGTSPPSSSHGAPANATVVKYLQQAETYYNAAQAALKSGNFATYGRDLALMKTALDNATNAAQGQSSPSASSSPSPSPRASP
jgi:uncharacterized membrane protein (UPF0182 family)